MSEPPVEKSRGLLHLTGGSLAYAGHHIHEQVHPQHSHSFVEIAVMVGGRGVHRSLAGRHRLRVGDVILMRPGVWHGYEDCRALDMYNCCFSPQLLYRELAWTREDPLLRDLLWAGPYAMPRRGLLTTRLKRDTLRECLPHLEALDRLRLRPVATHRGDVVGRLALLLSCLARAVARERHEAPRREEPTHPAVVRAIGLMQAQPAYRWTATELAARLHLSPGYLARLFTSATGLSTMAYLSRYRVELAATLLLGSDAPVRRIARSVGWPDQNYFARRFKAHYGLSASTFRSRFTATAPGPQPTPPGPGRTPVPVPVPARD